MKKMYKAMLLVLCAVLLVVASVMGTLAYLQMQTGAVTNTFTVGRVEITLDEAKVDEYGNPIGDERVPNGTLTGNAYKLIPGHTYTKDPTVTVTAGSEDCWIFVKVVNPIAGIESGTTIAMQMATNGWVCIDNLNHIYAYKSVVSAGESKVVFEEFTISEDFNGTGTFDDVVVIAYAIQADGFNNTGKTATENANEAWAAASANFT